MGVCSLDSGTRREIEKIAWALLRETELTSPPVNVPRIISHVKLHCEFYSLQNPTVFDHTKHKIIVYGQRLVGLLGKIKLVAVLLYDENRIVLDTTLPTIKHDWSTCHEIGHKIIPWHKTYFRGDTAQTLNPAWHEQLEAEANGVASELMFCGPVFSQEAHDVEPTWERFEELHRRYGKSMTATLRRFVERGPDRVMAMLVSTPAWKEKPEDQPERWRHFTGSPRFEAMFSEVTPQELLAQVDLHSARRRGGPIAEFLFSADDDNGEPHEFRARSFYNHHYILTLFVEVGQLSAHRIIVPGNVAL
ncbi:MAG: ImmA/IrrE family metallo-endopeptidase [Candidatus Brocadiia bacterium]